MKKLFPSAILALSFVVIALSSTGCRAARNDERLSQLENRVSALEAKVDIMHKP